MAYNRSHARTLCSDAELALFDASRREALAGHTAAQLRALTARARKLRDKYTDTYRRQRLGSRERSGSKQGRSGNANQRTWQKAKLFGEVLARFEARQQQMTQAAARRATLPGGPAVRGARAEIEQAAARVEATRGRIPANRPESRHRPTKTGFVDAQAAAVARQRHFQEAGNRAILGHVSAQGRRNQGKRDQR
ncbi:hypothetical protein [Rehaibacterium terrae]|jgi:hypothetical protein|uniref:Uncharacterized protein n=1 Tax=Rehaibacterium terrae TaxID=1341696 RepID=A0A7W7Y1P6_9GAMM|nr:hypothetical protein [Rehaibacterium terrae]MBB5016375.1 hypothetical protein [Rehaibacterium terrae]